MCAKGCENGVLNLHILPWIQVSNPEKDFFIFIREGASTLL